MAESSNMRIAKYLASAGIASRRHCEELIQEGRVTVNGKPILTPAFTVDPLHDVIKFEGEVIQPPQEHVTIMLNKPAGYTCSAQDEHAKQLVYELLPENLGRLFTVGRLDRETEGLLLLTNDGELAQKLTHPSFQVEKKYIAECEGYFTDNARRAMLQGISDEGELLTARQVTKIRDVNDHILLEVILTEGKKREVRRMCAKVGMPVIRLARTEFAGLKLGSLDTGLWRHLTPEEIAWLKKISTRRF